MAKSYHVFYSLRTHDQSSISFPSLRRRIAYSQALQILPSSLAQPVWNFRLSC